MYNFSFYNIICSFVGSQSGLVSYNFIRSKTKSNNAITNAIFYFISPVISKSLAILKNIATSKSI